MEFGSGSCSDLIEVIISESYHGEDQGDYYKDSTVRSSRSVRRQWRGNRRIDLFIQRGRLKETGMRRSASRPDWKVRQATINWIKKWTCKRTVVCFSRENTPIN